MPDINSSPLSTFGGQGPGVRFDIIPAIDIIDGKCVRLTKGDYSQKTVYSENPLEVAWQFQDAGIKRLHLVDLDGARHGTIRNWRVLEIIASKTSMVIDFGGGLKTINDVNIVFSSGASFATVGTIAINDPNEFKNWLLQFGVGRFLLGADVKNEKIAVNGWQNTTEISISTFVQNWTEFGVQQMFCTDISRDGMLQGPAIEVYKTLLTRFNHLHLIASGGISCISDIERLQAIGCRGAIIGKAIYEGKIKLSELKPWLE